MLWCKYVPVVDVCPIGKASEETIIHALVRCQFARQCWSVGFPGIQLDIVDDFQGWLSYQFDAGDKDRQAEIATLSWAIWKARNGVVWNQKQIQAQEVVNSASLHLVQ